MLQSIQYERSLCLPFNGVQILKQLIPLTFQITFPKNRIKSIIGIE